MKVCFVLYPVGPGHFFVVGKSEYIERDIPNTSELRCELFMNLAKNLAIFLCEFHVEHKNEPFDALF